MSKQSRTGDHGDESRQDEPADKGIIVPPATQAKTSPDGEATDPGSTGSGPENPELERIGVGRGARIEFSASAAGLSGRDVHLVQEKELR